jgi:hypothetical protein
MPVDIGKGQQVIPPRDSRSLEIVHFTAELAPIAKVRGGRRPLGIVRGPDSSRGLRVILICANLPW